MQGVAISQSFRHSNLNKTVSIASRRLPQFAYANFAMTSIEFMQPENKQQHRRTAKFPSLRALQRKVWQSFCYGVHQIYTTIRRLPRLLTQSRNDSNDFSSCLKTNDSTAKLQKFRHCEPCNARRGNLSITENTPNLHNNKKIATTAYAVSQ